MRPSSRPLLERPKCGGQRGAVVTACGGSTETAKPACQNGPILRKGRCADRRPSRTPRPQCACRRGVPRPLFGGLTVIGKEIDRGPASINQSAACSASARWPNSSSIVTRSFSVSAPHGRCPWSIVMRCASISETSGASTAVHCPLR